MKKKAFAPIAALATAAIALSLSACGNSSTQEPVSTSASTEATTVSVEETTVSGLFQSGTYTATSAGRNGDITVEVTFSEDEITDVIIKEHQETEGISDPAIEKIPANIIAAQSSKIDAIAGATITSDAILAAVEDTIRQAGADPSALISQIAETEIKAATLETDVIVVGGGLTGVSAALSASQNGAKVILIEKMSALGGSSGISGGGLAAGGTSLQAAAGIEDSPEAYAQDLLDAQKNSPNPSIYPDEEKVHWLAENAVDTIEWMVDMGYEFATPRAHGHGAARIHFPQEGTGGTLIRFFEDQLKEANVDIYLETRGTSLIQDDSGAVIGVEAESLDTHYTIYGKSTILATGGYASDPEMAAELVPMLADYAGNTSAAAGSTGDGIRMALEAGAVLYEDQWLHPLNVYPVVSEMRMSVNMEPHCYILVNADGSRFVDEDADSSLLYNGAVQDSGKKYIVFDSGEDFADFAQACDTYTQEQGVFKADTTKALADLLGADHLAESIEKYGHGDDAFGKDPSVAPVMETGPYYAVEAIPTNMGVFGGVKTNLDCQVLDEDGNVIPGLYAGGEMSNRPFFNQVYVGGTATECAATMGRIAGRHAAENQ